MTILDSLFSELTVYDCGLTKTRIGLPHDGGYVAIEELCQKTQVIYTFGVGDDVGFEVDFVRRFPEVKQINLFDHTIEALPEEHPKFVLCKQGIGWRDGERKKIPEHTLLKMDIEGDEWEEILWLSDKGLLQKFDQVLVEIHLQHVEPRHGLTPYFQGVDQRLCNEINKRQFRLYHVVLMKLNRLFYLVHIHANNSLPRVDVLGKRFPPLLELTFVRKKLAGEVSEATGSFPVPGLDFPNKTDRDDIEGFYPWH